MWVKCKWYLYIVLTLFFKQKTAYEMRISDWSSDVCSSDLVVLAALTAGIVAEDPVRALMAENALSQPQQVVGMGRTLQRIVDILGATLEDVDEDGALQLLDRRLRGQQRDADIGGDVERQAPEQAVHQAIPAAEAEQRVGLQEGQAPGAAAHQIEQRRRSVEHTSELQLLMRTS